MIQTNRTQRAYLGRSSVATGGPPSKVLALTEGASIVLALLTLSLGRNPFPSQDQAVLSFITGLDVPGLGATPQVVSFVTDGYAFAVIGGAAVASLLLVGRTRHGLVLLTLGSALALATVAADQVLGVYVGRGLPLADAPGGGSIAPQAPLPRLSTTAPLASSRSQPAPRQTAAARDRAAGKGISLGRRRGLRRTALHLG